MLPCASSRSRRMVSNERKQRWRSARRSQSDVPHQPQVGCLFAVNVRLVRLAQEAGMADVVGVADKDVRRHGTANAGIAAQLADDGADGRPIAFQEAGVEFRRRVPLLLELHIADDGELVGDLGLQRAAARRCPCPARWS